MIHSHDDNGNPTVSVSTTKTAKGLLDTVNENWFNLYQNDEITTSASTKKVHFDTDPVYFIFDTADENTTSRVSQNVNKKSDPVYSADQNDENRTSINSGNVILDLNPVSSALELNDQNATGSQSVALDSQLGQCAQDQKDENTTVNLQNVNLSMHPVLGSSPFKDKSTVNPGPQSISLNLNTLPVRCTMEKTTHKASYGRGQVAGRNRPTIRIYHNFGKRRPTTSSDNTTVVGSQ